MIVPLPRSRRTSEDNVLPLINIVFLLLIFFMIAGALSTTAPFELEPPQVRSAPDVPAPASAGLALSADGRVAFDGRRVLIEDLAERLRRWSESGDSANAPLTLRADGAADSRRLLAVINALRAAGIERVRLLAVGAEAGGE